MNVGFSAGNTVRGNVIFSNRGLGIDLLPEDGSQGPTPNDAVDSDAGGNDLQNFPVVTAVAGAPGAARVQGKLTGGSHGTGPSHEVDLHPRLLRRRGVRVPAEGFPGGTRLISARREVEAGHGEAAVFDVTLPVDLVPDNTVTATATDPAGNTSELSARIVFDAAPRSGAAGGGEALAIIGTDFLPDATVAVGGVVVSSVVAECHDDRRRLAAAAARHARGHRRDELRRVGRDAPARLDRGFPGRAGLARVPRRRRAARGGGISSGCGGGAYCVDAPVTRAQVAVHLLKARDGICDSASGGDRNAVFADVAAGLVRGGLDRSPRRRRHHRRMRRRELLPATAPCAATRWRSSCSGLLRAPSYSPPPCTGFFADVPCPSPFADWIEALAAEGITSGCGSGNYCPLYPVTRGQMAVLLARTFGLS